MILSVRNWLDGWIAVVSYWSISCQWQVAPPSHQ